MSDDIRTTARSEAQQIVGEAEGRADLLIEKARTRLDDVEREIEHLRTRRRETEVEIEDSIRSMQQTLEQVRAQEHQEDRIHLMRPRSRAAEGSPEDEEEPKDALELKRSDGQS